jgi:hypothetical protein
MFYVGRMQLAKSFPQRSLSLSLALARCKMYLKWTLTRIPTIFGQNSAAAGEAGVFCVSGVERPGAGKTGMPGIRAVAALSRNLRVR